MNRDSMLRSLCLIALCSVLCHCGSSDSEGLFTREAGASAPGSMAAAPEFAASASGAGQSASAPGDGTIAPRGAEAVPASSGPVNAATTPVAPIPAEPPPAEGSGADGQDEPEASDPADTPAEPTGPAPGAPDAVGVIQIERARWNEEDAELEVRGVVSSADVTLSVQFLERAETLLNEDGSFRGEFSAVEDNPEQVTVTASDGASATARVEVD